MGDPGESLGTGMRVGMKIGDLPLLRLRYSGGFISAGV